MIPESVRLVMQHLIETEVTEVVGAGRYERNDSRVTERNGSRPRLMAMNGLPSSRADGLRRLASGGIEAYNQIEGIHTGRRLTGHSMAGTYDGVWGTC